MPLAKRTNWRTGAEVMGLFLGAYGLNRLGEDGYVVVSTAAMAGWAWSAQGGTTLGKRRVHAICTAVMSVSVLSGAGRLVWDLDQMQDLQRVRLAAGIGLTSLDRLRFAGHLWGGEWYACARHRIVADGPVWRAGIRTHRSCEIPEGAEGLPIELLADLDKKERESWISWYLPILNDDEVVDAMFGTADRLVSVQFWEEKLTPTQRKAALERAALPDLTEEQQKALELIQGYHEGDDPSAELLAAVKLCRADDGLWMKEEMWAVLEKMKGVAVPERRRHRDSVMKVYTALDVEGLENGFCLFCMQLEKAWQYFNRQQIDEALGLPPGKDTRVLYQRFSQIGLETEEQVKGVIGETLEETLTNLKALADKVPYVEETEEPLPPAGGDIGHSELDRVLIEWRWVTIGVLGWLAIGDLLLRSASRHRYWACAGWLSGVQMALEVPIDLEWVGELVDDMVRHYFLTSTATLVGLDVLLRRTRWMGALGVGFGLGFAMTSGAP